MSLENDFDVLKMTRRNKDCIQISNIIVLVQNSVRKKMKCRICTDDYICHVHRAARYRDTHTFWAIFSNSFNYILVCLMIEYKKN
jgi:hypothetical protein